MLARSEAIKGCLLGTAVGDAFGLPFEGLSRRRAATRLGPRTGYRFLFGHGMVSDDTEHVCLIAQSLIESGGDAITFESNLARRLRRWFLCLPAGIGLATAHACCKLCLGVSPHNSGVFSAGNGPAMRASLLGVAIDDPEQLRDFVAASSRITHIDPKALAGAVSVAVAAGFSRRSPVVTGDAYLQQLHHQLDCEAHFEMLELAVRVVESVRKRETTCQFADGIGCRDGVSGYVYHSVPASLHAWLSHPEDIEQALRAVVACGGDTDSTGAIVGGIVGARVGVAGINRYWLDQLWEWPGTVRWMSMLGDQLAHSIETGQQLEPLELALPKVLMRNMLFLTVVLAHGFRRLLPPW